MLSEYQSVPKTTNNYRCCFFPSISQHVYPVYSEDNLHIIQQQRQKVEIYVFNKLEEYSKKKSISLFRLTSISHIRRRLQRDIKSLSKQFHPNLVPEQKLFQWIDQILGFGV